MVGAGANIASLGAIEAINAAAAANNVKQAGESAAMQAAGTEAKQAENEMAMTSTLSKAAGDTAKASV